MEGARDEDFPAVGGVIDGEEETAASDRQNGKIKHVHVEHICELQSVPHL